MVKKKFMLIILTIFLIVAGCGITPKRFNITKESFEKNYEAMFDAAIGQGAVSGYHPVYQDRKLGIINLVRVDSNTSYKINIQFFKTEDGNYISQITGMASDPVANILNNSTKDDINAAIMKASGVSQQ